jgi:hypothetical protein
LMNITLTALGWFWVRPWIIISCIRFPITRYGVLGNIAGLCALMLWPFTWPGMIKVFAPPYTDFDQLFISPVIGLALTLSEYKERRSETSDDIEALFHKGVGLLALQSCPNIYWPALSYFNEKCQNLSLIYNAPLYLFKQRTPVTGIY